jgi:hypothetical protein
VFQQAAVCLTKFGPESGETAKEILARKDLERRSGVGDHKNEFWWSIRERATARAILCCLRVNLHASCYADIGCCFKTC